MPLARPCMQCHLTGQNLAITDAGLQNFSALRQAIQAALTIKDTHQESLTHLVQPEGLYE